MKHFNLFSWRDVSTTLAMTVGSPSAHRRGTKLKHVAFLLLFLFAGFGQMWGAETLVYTLDGTTTATGNAYATASDVTQSSKSWKVTANTEQNPWRIGGKSITNTDRTIYNVTNSSFSDNICKVTLDVGATASSLTVNSITLIVSTAQNGGGTVTNTETKTSNLTSTTVTFNRPSGQNWSNKYFKIVFNVTRSSSSGNGYVSFNNAKFYKNTYTVAYNSNGGSGTMTDSNSPYNEGATVTVKSNTFTAPANKEFDEWKTGASSGTSYAADATFNITANTTLYAQWKDAAVACANVISLSKGTATNGTVNTISVDEIATCSETASDRRVTVTITPDACFNAPDELDYDGAGTATLQGSKTDNGNGTFSYVYQFAQNDNGSGTFGVTCTAKPAGKTVNFDAGPGVSAETSLTETCDGSGVTLPNVNATGVCKGWGTFAGWRASAIATADSTTTNPGTLLAAGSKYVPNSDGETLYAVYSKTKGTAATWTKVTSAPDDWSGDYVIVNSDGDHAMISDFHSGTSGEFKSETATLNQAGTQLASTPSNKAIWIVAKNGNNAQYSFKNKSTNTYANITGTSSTNAALSESAVWFTISSSGTTGVWKVNSVANSARCFAWYSSNNTFRTYANSTNNTGMLFKKSGGSTTYYCSDPNCCIDLGSINGSVSLSQKSATLTWDLTGAQNGGKDHINSWKVEYKLSSDDDWTVAESTLAKATLTKTISDLNCNTDYDFRVSANVQSGYCDVVKEWTSQKTTKFTITKDETGGGGITLSPAATSVCDGDVFDVTANTPDGSHEGTGTIKVIKTGVLPVEDVTSTVYNQPSAGKLTMPAYDITISATYTEKQSPSVGVSVNSLNFNEPSSPKKSDVVAAKTFNLTGSALEAGTLTLVAPSGYTVSPSEIAVSAGALAATEITVTPSTENAGTFNGSISISGAGVSSTNIVALTMTVQETYTVNWYVNGTKIDANSITDIEGTEVTAPSDFSDFTDCVPDFHFIGWATSAIEGGSDDEKPTLVTPITAIGTANVNYYAVFAEGTPASVDTLMYDAFTNDKTSDQSTAITAVSGNFTGSGKVYQGAYSTLKFGSSSDVGKITSKTLDLSDDFIVKMRAKKYSNDATTMYVKVGTDTRNVSTTDTLTGDFTTFTFAFEGTEAATIEIGVSNKRGYLDSVIVLQTVAEDFSMYYTTCPHVKRVTLSTAEVSNGSISFAQNSTPVTNVRTDGGADVDVDVVPDPATGYELTGVALSGTAASHASYDAGVITIDADAEGALTATATFAQANYTVTMAQTGGASAELSDDLSGKHYNDVITVTAEDKAGYVFKGWSASPAVTFANAKALSTTFSMPNGNVTVTAAYEVIHNVAWALANTPGSGSSDSVYVKGLISKKEKLENDNTISYWISDNGQHTTGSVLEVYKGRGVNKVTFSSLDDLNVGDAVVVHGRLKTFNSTKEFDSGNYMYSRTAAAVASVAIGGSAEKTAYSPSDNTFSFAGLTATATYNTGYVKDVTAEATWTANSAASYTVAAGGDVTVRATFGGQYDEEVVTVTYTTKTVKAIYLEYESTYTFKGYDLPKPKVYAEYVEEIADDEITSLVEAANGYDTESAYNKNTPGSYTINVAYETFNAEYTIQVRKIYDNADAPHNVADATALIVASAYQSTTPSTDYMWVRGIVSGFNGTYNNRYYISDDGTATGQLYVYNGTYFNGAAFTADNKLKVGDEVILKANILNYNGGTAELMNSQVTYQLRDPAFAFADVVAGDEFEPNFSADMTVEPTSNEGNAAFTLSSGNTDAVTIVEGKLHAVAEGDAVITASRAATDNTGSINYKAKNATFNVHVIAERDRYAITMDANGGSGTDPEYANQLEGATVDLPASCPYSKANSAFDAWVVTETESGDAVAVTNGHFTMPAAAVTIQATWNDVETCTISFYVSGSEVATADAPQTAEYTITQTADDVNGYEFVGWAESEETEDVETVLTTISTYTPALNEDSKILYAVFRKSVDGGEVTDEITNAELAATDNAYTAFTNVTISTSAVYAGKTSKSNGIQMNATSPNAIVTTTTGGLLKNISIEWNSNCTADRVLDVYAKNTAYTGSSDLWGAAAAQGTKVTSFTNNGSTTSYDFVADYAYIGVRSNDKALNINKISITWETAITYYTTNPVAKYNIKYRAGEAENVTGLCDADRTWGTITLCDAPTCADKNFAKWSDGANLYNAGAEYTLSADVTFTATWTPKPTYKVTYNTSGSTGTTPVDENEYLEGAEVTLASASGLSNAGYVFNGWSDGTQVYAAGYAEYAMPDHDVTFTATWAEISSEKWVLVTHEDALEIDGEYAIVSTFEDNNHVMQYFALGEIVTMNTNKAGKGEAVTRSGNIVRGSTDMVTFTLKEGSDSEQYAFKNGTNYLTWSSGNTLDNNDEVTANSSWTITIGNEDDIATIANVADNNRKLQYNSSSPRFACYTSDQKAVQLFKKAKNTVVEDATETKTSAEVAGGDITVGNNGNLTINVSVDKQAEDLTVKNGGKLTLSGDKTLKVNNVYLSATMASGKSSQMTGTLAQLDVQGEVYFDITLGDNGNAEKWHAFTVPFPVDAINGVYDKENNKLANEVNYAIMDYHGDIRATGAYGWKKFRGIMTPGTFYLMTVDGERTTYRFKKTADGALAAGNTKALTAYSGGGADTDQGWNGVGNPTMVYGTVDQKVQVLNPSTYTYEQFLVGAKNFVVGTPFFVQATTNGTMTMGAVDGEKPYYAPARVQVNEIKDIEVTFGNEEYKDRLYISASEDALNEYETGKDLAKMTMTSTPKVAQIFGKAYNAKLCMVYAPMSNDQAVYDLSLYAPANGEYTIAAPEVENADLYLTKDGAIIWNLTMSEYPISLNKGTTEGYGLLLNAKAPQTPTGVEQSEVSHQPSDIQKIIINDNVFILRGGQMYDVTGKAVK